VIAVVAVTLAAAGLWWFSRPTGPGAIVLVSIDTLRADHLPLYGYTKGRTPALDALARDAVVFDRAYSQAPQTLPSHTSMMTGMLPFEHGVRDNLGFVLSKDKKTLPSLLGAAGYATGGFVSAYVLRSATGFGSGFGVFDDKLPEGGVNRSIGLIQRPGDQTLAAATSWMDTLENDKFFLFLHLYEPHKPYAPPERFSGLAPYDGEISFADEITGHLMDYLKRRDWYDRAIIVVTGDHGEGLGDHGELEHGLFVYDEAIHVPWIAKLPGERSAGRRVAAPVEHIDLLPTLLSLASVPRPSGLRGRDLTPALIGRGALPPTSIYSEALYSRYHFGWSELLALTDERYRYIRAPREELYDLERDPHERQNIAGERPQTVNAMRSALDAMVEGRDVEAPSAVSAEDRQKLAALGYVGTQFSPTSNRPGAALPDPKDMVDVLRQYREAIDLLDERKFAGAAGIFKDLLAQQPDMMDVWVQYGAVLTRLGRDAEALDAYRQIVRLKPDEPSGLLGAASTLIKMGRLDEARQFARLAVKSAAANAHEMLATIALANRNWDEAQRQADLAAAADPGLPMPTYVRGLIAYHQQRYQEALPLLIQARDDWSTRTIQTMDLRYYIGDTLARLERYPEAAQFFQEEISLYPTNLRARAGLALLYASMNRPDDVEKAIDQMLVVSPAASTYQTAAKLWNIVGRPDKANAVLAEARARFGR
jgi:arylsulfatase A-like enzyme